MVSPFWILLSSKIFFFFKLIAFQTRSILTFADVRIVPVMFHFTSLVKQHILHNPMFDVFG